MAVGRRWYVLLLFNLHLFSAYGGNYSLCFIRHIGIDPKQMLVFVALDVKVYLSVTKSIDSSSSAIVLDPNERFRFDLTSPETNLRTGIENKGIKVTTSSKIHILGYDENRQSTDIFIPRKHSHLGHHYAVLTHCQNGTNCMVGIVAVKDSMETTISIILPPTIPEQWFYRGRNYTAGDVICLVLTSQQTFHLVSRSDLTGLVILSDANLAVIVGAGKTRVVLPESSADHIMETAPPVDFWGSRYLLIKLDQSYTDYVKIIAAVDNTVVTILSCKGTTTLVIERAFQDHVAYTMVCDYNFISTDRQKYILVGHFIRMENGNPSLYFPLPRKHFASSYIISSPPISIYRNCNVVLVAKVNAKIMYNSAIQVTDWKPIPLTDFLYTSFLVPTFGLGNTFTDRNGLPFGGYLCCFGRDSTAATALMPLSYDSTKISSSIFLRPEDIVAIDTCNETEASLIDATSTEIVSTMTETSTDDTSVADTSLDLTSVAIDNTTILANELTDNQILPTADVANLSTPTRTLCSCSTCRRKAVGNMTVVDLNKFLQEIKSEMLIKKNETAAWTRKMKCAEDPRPSSQGIGLVGSLLLCIAVGIVVLIDISNYCLVLKRRKIECSYP